MSVEISAILKFLKFWKYLETEEAMKSEYMESR